MGDLQQELLSGLEREELKLLSWGHVDGGFTRDEAAQFIDDALVVRGDVTTDADATLAEMINRRLLIEIPVGDSLVVRSRMAETVRLLARLRQFFPKHADSEWAGAAPLISDFRIVARPRSFPKQDIDPNILLDELEEDGVRPAVRHAAKALLDARGKHFRLSAFQRDACKAVLAGSAHSGDTGTIICAGTGSGKTLAFYLPALAQLAGTVEATARPRIIALYPRVELLRDQVGQVLPELRALANSGNRRSLRIGVLFSKTPGDVLDAVHGRHAKWNAGGGGRVCPYTRCPFCDRDGDLVWREGDLDARRHRLTCTTCGTTVDEIVLTRKGIRDEGVDLLFTTTEMLNRALADPYMRRGFGLDRGRPDFVLLDEIHTYGGVHGAHIGSLLRRLRAARPAGTHFVGLSATLAEAREFLAQLTDLHSDRIGVVEPDPRDAEISGHEYLIALRADPYSRAGVLSASIQTLMLLERTLDQSADPVSNGAFGTRLFAFTDDLDVTNRLYLDFLDAEGRTHNNHVQTNKAPLASLRAPSGSDLGARRAAGQVWDLPARIGWPLDDGDSARLRVGRTSSQDAGVDRTSEVIVATASLEVGYDDDRVGAVVQHKSPHDDAAFLQRKGRAGRTRVMRPWTAIVLSDFGRDRLTYLSYERLFDPYLAPRRLPIANPIVLRMQAALAMLDWLAVRHDANARASLAYPVDPDSRYAQRNQRTQAEMIETLVAVLDRPQERGALASHLQRALALDADTVQDLLWEPPRPLLTTVIPTALRRLESNWRNADGTTDRQGDDPLPEFIVSRLFADLELPETDVLTPDGERHPMRTLQALRAFAPGRVSHRLTLYRRGGRHWIEPPPLDPNASVALEVAPWFGDFDELGDFSSSPGGAPLHCVSPGRITLAHPEPSIRSSSNASLVWESEFVPSDTATDDEAIDIDPRHPVHDLVRRVRILTHSQRTPIELRRWARSARVELNRDGQEILGNVEFRRDDRAIGIGIAAEVDGLAIELAATTGAGPAPFTAELERSLRTARLRDEVLTAPELEQESTQFRRERLVDSYLAALIAYTPSSTSVREAHEALDADGIERRLGASDIPGGDAVAGWQAGAAVLRRAAPRLWEPLTGWSDWLIERTRGTIGAAVHQALQTLCPDYDFSEVSLDLRRRSRDFDLDCNTVWLTEATLGGGGPLQEAARRVAERPWAFGDLVLDAIGPTEPEIVDSELRRTLAELSDNQAVADAFAAVRSAENHHDRVREFEGLRRQLRDSGIFVCHPVIAAISTRLLRPGTHPGTDALLANLVKAWDDLEVQLDIEIPLTTFAWHAARNDSFEQAASVTPPGGVDIRAWRAGQLVGLLWPRAGEARRSGLRAPNQFHDLPPSDRLLAQHWLTRQIAVVGVDDAETLVASDGPLAREAIVDVEAPTRGTSELRRVLLATAASRVESGAVLLSPGVSGFVRGPGKIRARLAIEELA